MIKTQRQPVPSPQQVASFRREYEILKRLDSDKVLRCRGALEHDGRLDLVFEDFGGESLDKPLSNFV